MSSRSSPMIREQIIEIPERRDTQFVFRTSITTADDTTGFAFADRKEVDIDAESFTATDSFSICSDADIASRGSLLSMKSDLSDPVSEDGPDGSPTPTPTAPPVSLSHPLRAVGGPSTKLSWKDLPTCELHSHLLRLGVSSEELSSLRNPSFESTLLRKYRNQSLFVFRHTFFLRKFAIYLNESPAFNWFIVFLIVTNCVFLSLSDPTNPESLRAQIVEKSEMVFQILFTAEMCLKIFAMGFVAHRFAYMRDFWNLLDFFIVVVGWIGLLNLSSVLGDNMSAIRAFRVLRPLRAISGLPQMRIIFNSLVKSLSMLTNAFVLYCFFVGVFAVVGIQLFQGIFRNRCVSMYDHSRVYEPTSGASSMRLILQNGTTTLLEGPMPYVCREGTCPPDHICLHSKYYSNPSFGFVEFDEFPGSVLTLFTSVSMEGWFDSLMLTGRASQEWVAVLFYTILILLGNFFVVNLALVIIAEAYNSHSGVDSEIVKIKETLNKRRRIRKVGMKKRRGKLAVIGRRIVMWLIQAVQTIGHILCPRILQQFQKKVLRPFVTHWIFQLVFIILTVINTVMMAIENEKAQSVPYLQESLTYANYVFIGLFLFESIIKVCGLGVVDFLKDKFNIFDAVIVSISLAEIAVNSQEGQEGSSSVLSTLRAFKLFRALRIVRLIRTSSGIKKLLKVVVKSVVSAFYITALLFVIVLIFALLGLQLYGTWEVSEETTLSTVRASFDDLGSALLTTFQIVTGENWNLILYKYVYPRSYYNIPYFIILYIAGNTVFLNLFIAVVFESFQTESEKKIQDSDVVLREKLSRCCTAIKGRCRTARQARSTRRIVPLPEDLSDEVRSIAYSDDIHGELLNSPDRERKSGEPAEEYIVLPPRPVAVEFPRVGGNEDECWSPKVTCYREVITLHPDVARSRERVERRVQLHSEMNPPGCCFCFATCFKNHVCGDYSLCLFPNDCVRKALRWFVTSRGFELFIMLFIITSTVTLALEDPFMLPESGLAVALYWMNFGFTLLFSLEMLLKILASGLIFQQGAYLREAWNWMDAFIVLIGLFSMMDGGDEFGEFKVLRMLRTLRFVRTLSLMRALKALRTIRLLRTLRPLRALNKLEGLKLIVDCLLSSIPNILSVFVLQALIFFIFAIMGVSLFGDSFSHCSVGKYEYDKEECLARGYEWTQSVLNFDNIANACLTLFALSTLEGWETIMYAGIDIPNEVDKHPIRGNHIEYSMYFIGFVVIGAFFLQNLFVGVLIDKYHSIFSEKGASEKVTEDQQGWIDMQKMILSHKPTEHKAKRELAQTPGFRARLHLFVDSTAFEIFLTFCIFVNSATMALEFYGSSSTYNLVLTIANLSFTGVFSLECLLKIIAFGFRSYFGDRWNQFDFMIVVVSVASTTVSFLPVGGSITSGLTWTSVFRVLRIARLFRIVKRATGLRTLLQTMLSSIMALLNVAILMFLFFFIFAILGVKFFGKLEYGTYINSSSNFSSVLHSMILLFRVMTGEGWADIMNETMVGYDSNLFDAIVASFDKANLPHNCRILGSCGVAYAPVFFFAFIVCGTFVLSNLFIAVIMQSFSFIVQQQKSPVNERSLNKFLKTWTTYDPDLTLFIPKSKLTLFLTTLGEPLGVPRSIQAVDLTRFVNALSLAEYDGKVQYLDVIHRLAKTRWGVSLPPQHEKSFEKMWRSAIPSALHRVDIHQLIAAIKVKNFWKKKIIARRIRKLERKKKMRELEGRAQSQFHDRGRWLSEIPDVDIDEMSSFHESDHWFRLTDGSEDPEDTPPNTSDEIFTSAEDDDMLLFGCEYVDSEGVISDDDLDLLLETQF